MTHISFADAGEASGAAVTELTAQATPISSIQPFLEQESVLSDAPWGWIAGAALGGGAIGALLANGGDGGGNLDRNRYLELETPRKNVRPVHCAEVNPPLFARIVNICVEPGRRRNSDRTRAWPPFLQTTPPFCWAG